MSQMNDLISRQAALDALRSCQTYLFDAKDPDEKIELRSAELVIEGLPPAQPERKRGEWEEIEVIADAYDISGVKTWASKMKCDQCGFTTIAVEGHFSQYNFCPNCGADMRGGNP